MWHQRMHPSSTHPTNILRFLSKQHVRMQQPVDIAQKSHIQYRRDALSALTGQPHARLSGYPSLRPFRPNVGGVEASIDETRPTPEAAPPPSDGPRGGIVIAFASLQYRVLESQATVRLMVTCRRCAHCLER